MEEIRKEPVTVALILINVLIFIAVELTAPSQHAWHVLNSGAAYTPYIVEKGEVYRLFTSMFLHFGIEHLVNNMLVLFVLGSRLEQVIGKIRYAHKGVPCRIYMLDDDRVRVVFDEPVRAATKGQAVVFYENDYIVGGGTIKEIIR